MRTSSSLEYIEEEDKGRRHGRDEKAGRGDKVRRWRRGQYANKNKGSTTGTTYAHPCSQRSSTAAPGNSLYPPEMSLSFRPPTDSIELPDVTLHQWHKQSRSSCRVWDGYLGTCVSFRVTA